MSDTSFIVDWDIPRPHPLSTLISARLELTKCQHKLKNQIIESQPYRNIINESRKELKGKQTSLNVLHLEFEKLESEDKQNRAKEKLNGERSLQEKLKHIIENVKEEVDKLANDKEQLEQYLKQYQKFEEYLSYVVQHSNDFSSVEEVLDRYKTLRNMQTKLKDDLEADLQFMIESRNDIDDLTEEKCNTINILCNRLAKIRAKAVASSERRLHSEIRLKAIKTFAAEKKIELEMVKSAAWSLYLQIRRNKLTANNTTVEKRDFEKQMKIIYKTIIQYKRIVQIAQSKSGNLFPSNCPNSSVNSLKKRD